MEQQAGQFFVLAVMALIIVGAALKLYVDHVLPRQLARRPVNRSTAPATAYVAQHEQEDGDGAGFPLHRKAETETLTEMETAGKPAALSQTQLTELLEQTRREARASALGTLIGAGLLVEGGRTRAMTLLFGPPGRKHSAVKAWVDAAEASTRAGRPDEPEPEARVIPVGRDGHFVEV